MADIVYDYPQSSCQCYNCSKKNYHFPTSGVPTNLSVRNCNISSYYDCFDRRPFKQAIEPHLKEGFNIYNPEVALQSYAPEFQKIACKNDKDCSTVYISTDPRLIDVPRSQLLPLDRPPYDDTVKLENVYTDKTLRRYGKDYRTYSDINAGQITYYTDKSIEDAFFQPNFSTSATMVGTMYKDPMGAMKPQYDRYPLKCDNHLNTDKDSYDGGLSWISDSMEFRQDLMAKQMRKSNQTRWSPRWTGLDNE